MRLLTKRELWLQAAVIASLYPVVAFAAALNIAVGALGFHSIFKRQADSLEEWRARPAIGDTSEPVSRGKADQFDQL